MEGSVVLCRVGVERMALSGGGCCLCRVEVGGR